MITDAQIDAIWPLKASDTLRAFARAVESATLASARPSISEMLAYADHTHSCAVTEHGYGVYCTCGYDAAYSALAEACGL